MPRLDYRGDNAAGHGSPAYHIGKIKTPSVRLGVLAAQ